MRWLPIIGILIIIATIIIFVVDGIRSAVRTSRKRKELLKSGNSGVVKLSSVSVPASESKPKPKRKTETANISSVLSNFRKKE